MRNWLIAFICLSLGQASAQELPLEKSQVFYATDSTSLDVSFRLNPVVVRRMVDDLVMAVTRQSSVASAWRSLLTPQDVVGIKVSATGGAISGTHPPVVEAVALGLKAAGFTREQIIVWDRDREDLLKCGYRENSPLYTLAWTDPLHGYDKEQIATAPLLGRLIWGDSGFGQRTGKTLVDQLSSGDQLSSQSHYSKILTRRVTKVINIPTLMDSFRTGIHGAMVNMTVSNIDNWRRFARPPQHGDPYIAELYAEPLIFDKVVLTILDALVLQYAGGPFPNPNFRIENYMLFASEDPVALDSIALRLLNEQRKLNRLPDLTPMTGHVRSAAEIGLGNDQERHIQMIRVGSDGLY